MKPFDISKFRKDITKSVEGISVGFNDPKYWIDTGNYALNYAISSDFYKGVPLGKVTMFAGESGCLPETAKIVFTVDMTIYENGTVGQLKELLEIKTVKENVKTGGVDVSDKKIQIMTPDGMQNVTTWFNKGKLDMVRVTGIYGSETICSRNHLLERLVEDDTFEWVPAENINVGDKVFTEKGIEIITEVETLKEKQYCYDFTIDHDNHRYYGDGFSSHNSGKSYIVSGNMVRNAQKQGIYVVLIDTENALDSDWLEALGVDTSEDKLLKINVAMIDDVSKIISDFVKNYKTNYIALPREERPKVLFVLDSIGMLLTPTDVAQFESGDLKGDLGRKPKALNALVRNCVNMFGDLDIGLVSTNHTYVSMDPYNPDNKISGGQAFVYASSIVLNMQKLKLKEDEDGNKTTDVKGIRSKMMVAKSRYAKPFETVEVRIPYDKGMDAFSGLLNMFESKGVVVKEGNKLKYTTLDGVEHKYFRKQYTNEILKMIMDEYPEQERRKMAELANSEIIDDTLEEE